MRRLILNTLFNPLYSEFKSIQGSITAGSCLRLRVQLPKSMCCSACFLLITDGSTHTEQRGMFWESTDGNTEWWGTDLQAEKEGLIFYRFELNTPSGIVKLSRSKGFEGVFGNGESWQITVYSPDFKTPDWIKGGIIYQIFPDRFKNSGKEKSSVPSDRILRSDWGGEPVWEKDKNGDILNNDYFCGDFKGIEEELPYIASLGVNCIYLNPVAEAHSNHRYDVADYMKPDPLLGTEKDFISLCKKASGLGIKIMTDGVFSHTGSDSIYFNKNKRYGNSGAFNSPDSPYFKWYSFDKIEKYGYLCWWNVPTLPEVNENEPSFTDFITGENGVIEHWLRLGACALRLDVADELPDAFLDNVRKRLKKVDPDAFLLGEVWEDASNKVSYGSRRRYLTGNQLDSVMNYPFRDAIISFVLGGSAEDFSESVLGITENYPKPALDCMMNHLGTHDTERILTVLGGINCSEMSRAEQSRVRLSDSQLSNAVRLLKMAYTILYTLPGVPSVYYGDEALMQGCRDPFNRGCFNADKTDSGLVSFLRTLGDIRRSSPCLANGEFNIISSVLGCSAYIRKSQCGISSLLVIANRNSHPITYKLFGELLQFVPLLNCTRTDNGINIEAETCALLRLN